MSFETLAWAGQQRGIKPTVKLTLLGLASCAGAEHEAYPSTAWLVEFTGLDRKTVIAAVDALQTENLIADTGARRGETKQIKVYRLAAESVPKTERFQKRNAPVSGAKASQKRDTELVREPVEKVQAPPSPSPRSTARKGDFASFWEAFPKKVGKPVAERAYLKACRVVPPDKILAAAQAYAASRADEDPQFTAHPTTWLNQGRYDDQIEEPHNARTGPLRGNGQAISARQPRPGTVGWNATRALLQRAVDDAAEDQPRGGQPDWGVEYEVPRLARC